MVDIILNRLLIGIPEGICIFALVLIIAKKYEYIEPSILNILRLVVISEIYYEISNIFKSLVGIQFPWIIGVNFISTGLLAILLYWQFDLKSMSSIMKGSIMVVIYKIIMELSLSAIFAPYIPILNKSNLLYFVTILGFRIIDICIIVMLGGKYFFTYEVNVFKNIIKNKILVILSFILIIVNTLMFILVYHYTIVLKLENITSNIYGFAFLMIMLESFPFISLTFIYLLSYTIEAKRLSRLDAIYPEIQMLKNVAKTYTQKKEVRDIIEKIEQKIDE